MPKVELDMSYDEILARKTKIERDLADIDILISKKTEKQAELAKWDQLEKAHRPKNTVDPFAGLPQDTDLFLNK